MRIYKLLEYNHNYSITSASLWNYYRNKVNDSANENANNYKINNNNKTATTKYFQYKTKLIGSIPNTFSRLNAEVVVPLKYLGNFWRSSDLLLIKSERKLELAWLKNCLISETSRIPKVGEANPVDETLTFSAKF